MQKEWKGTHQPPDTPGPGLREAKATKGLILSQVPACTHSIVWMEDIGGRRIVQDEHSPEVAAQPTQVLHVVAPVEHTRLPEQPGPEGTPLVQQVSYWVCILGGVGSRSSWGGRWPR